MTFFHTFSNESPLNIVIKGSYWFLVIVNLVIARMAQMTLELLELEYDFKQIDLTKNEQKEEWYLKINPKVKRVLS